MTATSLEQSYDCCVKMAKDKAKHFHYGFQLLADKDRYKSICALYAFARLADDFSDDGADAASASAAAKRWQAAFDKALAGDPSEHPILPAVIDTVKKHHISKSYFDELIAGTEMDSRINRYAKWDDTYHYCYRVASVIGLMTIHVFGFEHSENSDSEAHRTTCTLAEHTGIAFQMTNILRDIKEDAQRDRIYLPQEDLQRFDVSEAQILACEDSPAFRKLVQFEVERAKKYYEAATELTPLINKGSQKAFRMMVSVYKGLLTEIERREYDVLSRRVSLSTTQKLACAGGALLKGL